MPGKKKFISSLAEQRRRNSQLLKEAKETRLLVQAFDEVFIARLFLVKPRQISCIEELAWLDQLILFRRYVRDTSLRGVSKGWLVEGAGRDLRATYGMTPSKIARLDVLIEALLRRKRDFVELEESMAIQKKQADIVNRKIGKASCCHDPGLYAILRSALDSNRDDSGYVYFKQWMLPDGTCWFKLGITSSPNRRDSEQNVLPVLPKTLCCVRVSSMDRARAIESCFHGVLSRYRIVGAGNRELFVLSLAQAGSVRLAFESMGEA